MRNFNSCWQRMPSLIQKHAHVKGQRSNHHIFKFQPNPSWAKKRPNRYTSFDMQHDHVLKKLTFDLLTGAWGGSADKKFATMLLHLVIPFNLICSMTIFWKSWILTYCSHPWGCRGRGSPGKILATMLLHSWFSLIWYAPWPYSEKV